MMENLKTRREFLTTILLSSTALVMAACTTGDGRVGVPVNVTLPPEVTQIVTDAEAIVAKGKKLLSDPATLALVAQAEGVVASLKSGSGGGGGLKSTVGTLAGILGTVSGFLPPPYNLAAGVLVTIAKAYVGQPIKGRLAMSPEAARRVLQN
jgi:hypothetical protein